MDFCIRDTVSSLTWITDSIISLHFKIDFTGPIVPIQFTKTITQC